MEFLLSYTVIIIHIVIIFGFILIERRSPLATLAWLLILIFLPVIGLFLYFLLGNTRMARIRKKSERVSQRLQEVLAIYDFPKKLFSVTENINVSGRTKDLIKLTHALSNIPATTGNSCEVLSNAAKTYRETLICIKQAIHHIHVEFYIFRDDKIGKTFLKYLTQKAKAGVEVRVLYDAVGSASLTKDFWQELVQAGGKAVTFKPIHFSLFQRDRIDFRNHRKIVIVDGRVGLTGGINIGQEYLGLDPEIGYWRDCHIKIEGPAVLALQQTFAEDWLFATGEMLKDIRYYPTPHKAPAGEAIVDIIESGPDCKWMSIKYVCFQAIVLAQKRVWITSPYFVPDRVMEEALITAALRGVDVCILLPSSSDLFLAKLASSSYYPRLLEAGVHIYEYTKGFIHAKTLVVDDWMGTIGSANMDIRSFKLNFELNAVVYHKKFTQDLAQEFENDLRYAKKITLESYNKMGYFHRLAISSARLLSPLL